MTTRHVASATLDGTLLDALEQAESPNKHNPFLTRSSGPGNVYYLDPTNGDDANDGKGVHSAFATLPTAYAALTAGQHDILYYIAGSSSISLTAAFDWAKDYTHFIGIAAPTSVGSRSRIFQDASATGLSPLITISGNGCIWKSIYAFQGVNDATSLIAVTVTGDRCNFIRCNFVGGGHAACAIDNSASIYLNNGSENTFDECVFGNLSIEGATGANVMRIGSNTARNVFNRCIFQQLTGSTSTALVELTATDSLLTTNYFNDCVFTSESVNKAVTASTAFVIPSGHTTTATVLMKDCMGNGFAKWDANARHILYGNMGTPAGLDGSGVAILLET